MRSSRYPRVEVEGPGRGPSPSPILAPQPLRSRPHWRGVAMAYQCQGSPCGAASLELVGNPSLGAGERGGVLGESRHDRTAGKLGWGNGGLLATTYRRSWPWRSTHLQKPSQEAQQNQEERLLPPAKSLRHPLLTKPNIIPVSK